MEKIYCVIRTSQKKGALSPYFYDTQVSATLKHALDQAHRDWSYLTDKEKEITRICVVAHTLDKEIDIPHLISMGYEEEDIEWGNLSFEHLSALGDTGDIIYDTNILKGCEE